MTPASAARVRCRLHEALGRSEACPGARCPFWEPGGAVLPARCAVAEIDLDGRRELAAWLLEMRHDLEAALTTDEQRQTWRELHARLHGDEDE